MARRNVVCDFETFPYNQEYYAHLLAKEDERYHQYYYQKRSPQLNFRRGLIKSLTDLSGKLGLGPTTFHLSVHLLDIFMDCHEIDQQQLMLTASTCLLIAAKYVDVDSNVPKLSILQTLTNHHNSLTEYKIMEKMLLSFWKWDLNFATTLHFLDYYFSCDPLFINCADGLHHNSLNSFRSQAVALANLTLSETDFIYFKSSIIAASCIAAARIQFRLFPTWPASLANSTGYSHVEIEDCLKVLIHFSQITQSECFFSHTLHQASTLSHEKPGVECKWKLRAVGTYNCSRTKRRHLLNSRDLKQMYCAM